MKTVTYQALKNIFKDRLSIAGLVILVLASLGSAILVAFNIKMSELQVSVHYTSFGGENIYRDQWFYLIAFAVFGVIVALIHSVIFIKLHNIKGRGIALLFGYSTVAVLVIATAMFYKVATIAALT